MATYSISGTISPLSFVNVATTIVSCNPYFDGADGVNISPSANGNYTISGLAPGTYIVQASGSNFLSPAQTVAITAANLTGVNFVATAAPNFPVYNPIFVDSFQRANENPLNDNGAWSPPNNNSGLITSTYLQILNNQCTSLLSSGNDGAAVYVDVSPFSILPADQYSSAKIAKLGNSGNMYLYVRGTLPGIGSVNPALFTTYVLFLGNSDGIDAWGVYAIDDLGNNVPYTWVAEQAQTINIGDIWTLAIAGQGANGVLYVYQNGVCLWQASIAPNPDLGSMNANGTVGLQLDLFTPAQNDIAVTNFISGGFSIASNGYTNGSLFGQYDGKLFGNATNNGWNSSNTTNPNLQPENDLLQILAPGGACLLQVTSGGIVNTNVAKGLFTNATTIATVQMTITQYNALPTFPSAQQICAAVFPGNSGQQLDIFQVINVANGGAVIYRLTFAGQIVTS